jgi:hypothetical protein
MNSVSLSNRARRAAALVCLLSVVPLAVAGVPGAPPQGNGNTKIVSGPFGHSYSELAQDWWLWDFSLPAAQNPTSNFAASCTNGQTGSVWFLFGGPPTVNCTVPAGVSIFLPIVNTECSSIEPAPFHGDTPQERQACAKAWIDNVTDLSASVDGVPITNFGPLRTRSNDFSFTVPSGNILGVPGPAWGFSSADGYYMLFTSLAPGNHVITIAGVFHDPFTPGHPVVFPLSTTIYLQIVP